MPRVTENQVKNLLDLGSDSDRDVAMFIETAGVLIDEFLSSEGLSDNLLAQIELYLSAHFALLTEERGGLVRDSMGDSAQTYSDIYDKGLANTRYGQQAMMLDSSGKLSELSKSTSKLKARLTLI